jgi:hypothetical protein
LNLKLRIKSSYNLKTWSKVSYDQQQFIFIHFIFHITLLYCKILSKCKSLYHLFCSTSDSYSIIQEESESDECSDGDTVLPPITVVPPLPMPKPDSEMPTPLPSPTVLPLMQPEMVDDWIDRKLAEQREG